MHSSNHKSRPSIASSLPGAADKSAAIRQGKLEISHPIPIPYEALDEPDPKGNDRQHAYHSSTSFAKTDTWPRRGTAPALHYFDRQDNIRDPAFHASNSYNSTNRTSALLTNSHQSMSSFHSGGSASKSGGIRATFRRMFGSKRRRDTVSADVNHQRTVGDTDLRPCGYLFTIEPSLPMQNSGSLLNQTATADRRPLRKPSLLFEELIRGRALNSHAPNVIPQESELPRNDGAETVRPPVRGFGRRNSLPSVILSSQEAQRLDLCLNQNDAASEHKVHHRPLRRMPNRSLLDTVKRKSRSADALRDMAASQNSFQAQERRLSDEIKYWRNSVIEDPIPSLTSRRKEMIEEVEACRSASSQTPTLPMRRPSNDVSVKPQGFDFSGLAIGNVDASVEQRIATVEVKLIDLECAIANLQNHDALSIMQGKAARRKPLQESSGQAEARSTSIPALFPKSSFDSFSTRSSASNTREDQSGQGGNSAANTLRPETSAHSAASTAAASHPPLPTQSPTDHELARVVSMLTQEQEARRGLETQLKDLQKQMNDLHSPAAHRGPPTPNHFSTLTSNMLDSSPIPAIRHTVLPFRTASLGVRSSNKENESEETDTDDGFLDVYETPTEAREYGYAMDAPRSPPLVGVV
jgi:hypothetical protein